MIKDGFVCCPACGRKTRTKTMDNTIALNFPLFCHWCKRTTIIDIMDGKAEKAGVKGNEVIER